MRGIKGGSMFGWILGLIDYSLCSLQAYKAWTDGWFSQKQLRKRGITNAYSHLQHGGWWANLFIVSPIVVYVTTKYQLAYFSFSSLIILLVAIAITGVGGYGYAAKGEKTMPEVMRPDAYVHDGKTTTAGWLHLLFAAAVLYIIGMFYFTPMKPLISHGDVWLISGWLSPFFFLGICKFSRQWKFSHFAKWQVALQLFALWGVAFHLLGRPINSKCCMVALIIGIDYLFIQAGVVRPWIDMTLSCVPYPFNPSKVQSYFWLVIKTLGIAIGSLILVWIAVLHW